MSKTSLGVIVSLLSMSVAAIAAVAQTAPAGTPAPPSPEFRTLNPTCEADIVEWRRASDPTTGIAPARTDPSRPLAAPNYPPASLRAGEEGMVVVSILVNQEGQPTDARIQRSSGFPRLDDSAIYTTRYWHFIPATRNNEPVCMRIAVPLTYKLENRPEPAGVASETRSSAAESSSNGSSERSSDATEPLPAGADRLRPAPAPTLPTPIYVPPSGKNATSVTIK